MRIIDARRRASEEFRHFDTGFHRSRDSGYLLSGGLFKCGRCGCNMTGRRTSSGRYYICGSAPYRRGMGCGPGVWVPQDRIEGEVLQGLRGILALCDDPKEFTGLVNAELSTLWRERNGHDADADRKLGQIEAKLANIHQSIEDGLADVSWANERLAQLQVEQQELGAAVASAGECPHLGVDAVTGYRRDTEGLLRNGDSATAKQLLRTVVAEATLAPEALEAGITYRLPEPVVHQMVAGACYGSLERVCQPDNLHWRYSPGQRHSVPSVVT